MLRMKKNEKRWKKTLENHIFCPLKNAQKRSKIALTQRRTYALGFQKKVADSTRIPGKKVADSTGFQGKKVADSKVGIPGIPRIPGFRDSGIPGFQREKNPGIPRDSCDSWDST